MFEGTEKQNACMCIRNLGVEVIFGKLKADLNEIFELT